MNQNENLDSQIQYEGDPDVTWENIGPDLAIQYLERNKCNRHFTQSEVDRMAEDMRLGDWEQTHQGIAFDENGDLIDGQKRLWAIAESKVTIRLMVTRGVLRKGNAGIDSGKARTINDVLFFRGVKTTTLQTAIATLLVPDPLGRWPSKARIMECFYKHEAAIRAITGFFPKFKPRITIKAVLTPLVRAWYTVDVGRLRRFAEVLFSGEISGDDEKVIVKLRDHLLQRDHVNGRDMVMDIYLKTERHLVAYLNGEYLSRATPASTEQFPLPSENGGAPAQAKQQKARLIKPAPALPATPARADH